MNVVFFLANEQICQILVYNDCLYKCAPKQKALSVYRKRLDGAVAYIF